MNRTICLAAMLAAFSAARADPLLPTDIQIRIGSDRHYFESCETPINRLEPGDDGVSVLNVRSCDSYDKTSAPAPSWIKVPGARYGRVFLPDGTVLFRCALIEQQVIAVGEAVRQTITLECPEDIHADGFEPHRRPSK